MRGLLISTSLVSFCWPGVSTALIKSPIGVPFL